MTNKFAAAAVLVAACLVSAPQQAHAQDSNLPTPELIYPHPADSCLWSATTIAEASDCFFNSTGAPNPGPTAQFTTPAGTYTVTCTSAGGCSFSFAERNPIRPRTQEP